MWFRFSSGSPFQILKDPFRFGFKNKTNWQFDFESTFLAVLQNVSKVFVFVAFHFFVLFIYKQTNRICRCRPAT